MYLQSAEDGPANLYFNRGVLALSQADIYYAAVARDGETRGPAVLVRELSVPGANDAAPTVRNDGKEVVFYSSRVGSLGGTDLWMSIRRNATDPWSEPVNLGAPLNSAFPEVTPSLSFDGRTMVFASNRPGGIGGNDIWVVTRRAGGKP
jgi:Tol biopolymer transport system component